MLKLLSTLLFACAGLLFAAGGTMAVMSQTEHWEYRLVIAAMAAVIAAMSGAIVALYKQGFKELQDHSKTEAEMAEMLGKVSLLLQQIPDHLRRNQGAIDAALNSFRSCMSGCSEAQVSMKVLADRYLNE